MNKRLAALQKAKQTKVKTDNVEKTVKTPSMPSPVMSDVDSIKMDVELNLANLKSSLAKMDMSLETFVETELGITSSKPARTISAPNGESYTVVTSHFSVDELKDKCVIDDDNIRDSSERTREALWDIIDEIGSGLQIHPLIAYIDENGKVSIVDGSRRLECGLLEGVGLDIEIFDSRPDEETVQWIVEASDRKKKFSYYERGKLFLKLMAKNSWKQADVVANRPYSKQEVSRCVGVASVNEKLMAFMPTKDLTQAQADKLISSANYVQVNGLETKLLKQFEESIVSDNVTPSDVIGSLVAFVANAKGTKAATQKPESLFEKGKTKVTLHRPSAKKSRIDLELLPKEAETEVIEAIKQIMDKYV